MSTSNTDSDELLLYKIREAQDNHSFNILASRHRATILKKCNTWVKNTDIAEDLTQEILIKLFLHAGEFRKEAKFTTWLYSIIYHTCIDHLRKKKRTLQRVFTEKLAGQIADDIEDNDDPQIEITEKVLETLLEELGPEERIILVLKYQDKHSIKDIQTTLHISESAVKMRLLRARKRMNELYKKYEASGLHSRNKEDSMPSKD